MECRGLADAAISRSHRRGGEAATQALHRRVVEELGTTFRSGYGEAVSLADLLDPGLLTRIAERKTGAKVLVEPQR